MEGRPRTPLRLMAKVERLPSGKFRIRWTDPTGRRTSRTFSTAADARAWQRKVLGDMARGEYIDPRRSRTTLAQWAEDWLLGARNLGAGGRDMYRQALDHILPELGRISLGRLSAVDIDRYLALGLNGPKPLAPSTVHRHYRTLHRMLAVAVERGMIARNPCNHVQPPRIPRTQLTVLDAGQVDALATAISPRYRAWVYVAAYGGLRWSETVGLRRCHVEIRATPPPFDLSALTGVMPPVDSPGDQPGGWGATPAGNPWERPTARRVSHHIARLLVVEQLIRRRDRTWDRVEPKVGSRRTVTLPNFAATELATHLDTYSLDGPDGLVFCTKSGLPLYGGSWTSNIFKRALAKAGLPNIRIHDLRHTAASLAIASGANVKALQARMGHSSASMTLDVYGHLMPGGDEAVAAGLEGLRAEAQRKRLRVV